MDTCPECDGTGYLVLVGGNGHQLYRESYLCSFCHGSGVTTKQKAASSEELIEARSLRLQPQA